MSFIKIQTLYLIGIAVCLISVNGQGDMLDGVTDQLQGGAGLQDMLGGIIPQGGLQGILSQFGVLGGIFNGLFEEGGPLGGVLDKIQRGEFSSDDAKELFSPGTLQAVGTHLIESLSGIVGGATGGVPGLSMLGLTGGEGEDLLKGMTGGDLIGGVGKKLGGVTGGVGNAAKGATGGVVNTAKGVTGGVDGDDATGVAGDAMQDITGAGGDMMGNVDDSVAGVKSKTGGEDSTGMGGLWSSLVG